MSNIWYAFATALLCSWSLSGCLAGSPADYHYSVEDAEGSPSSPFANDSLFTITLGSEGATDMKISSLVVVVIQDGVSHPCLSEGEAGNCTVSQPSETDNTLWEEGETLTVSESGTDICGRTCIITFTVQGPEGSQTTGPTILTVN